MTLPILLIFFGTFSFSKELEEIKTLQLFKNNSYISIKVKTSSTLHLSENCFHAEAIKCAAYDATKSTHHEKTDHPSQHDDPAAKLCYDKDGITRILIDSEKNQYEYCTFNDGSMIDSWDLFYHFYPKKQKKL